MKMNVGEYRPFWCDQLLMEYDTILWSYNIDLSPPILEISESKLEMGSWNSTTRTLALSSHLITQYPWTVVQQVLKHEMAHQVCSELMGSSETGHGRDFLHACELLCVEAEFCGSCSTPAELEAGLAGKNTISGSGRKFIDRIEKLLALATSPNEHEAALAMEKATELIDKYGVSAFELGRKRNFGYILINRKRKRIERYQRVICRILQDFFSVRVVMSTLYDPFLVDSHKVIELLGTRENVVIAEYCYYFLENKLESLWNHNRHRFRGQARREKNSYFLGLLAGFYKKLEQGREKREKRGGRGNHSVEIEQMLMVSRNELDRYVSSRFPRLRKARRSGAKVYRNTYSEGVKTGGTITLAKGVSGDSKESGRFVTDG
ncbi:SprT-like domain-containing protein [Desulfomarina sp.]